MGLDAAAAVAVADADAAADADAVSRPLATPPSASEIIVDSKW